MTKHFVRNPYNYDMDAESDRTGLMCKDKSLTKQEFVEETNINYIAERYGLTGEAPQVQQLPSYGDFEGIYDFQDAQNAVVEARQKFMELPAKVRARFQNDPNQLIKFMDDESNLEEARFLNLVEKEKPLENDLSKAPQSPQGDPAGSAKGEPPTPPAKPAGEPTPKK